MSTIDLMYRHPQYGFGGPTWVDPNGNWNGYYSPQNPGIMPVPGQHRYGPIDQRPVPIEFTPEQLEELRRALEQHRNTNQFVTTTTTDGSAAPAPVQAAPVVPEPEGVDTTDSFRPQRKLDLD